MNLSAARITLLVMVAVHLTITCQGHDFGTRQSSLHISLVVDKHSSDDSSDDSPDHGTATKSVDAPIGAEHDAAATSHTPPENSINSPLQEAPIRSCAIGLDSGATAEALSLYTVPALPYIASPGAMHLQSLDGRAAILPVKGTVNPPEEPPPRPVFTTAIVPVEGLEAQICLGLTFMQFTFMEAHYGVQNNS